MKVFNVPSYHCLYCMVKLDITSTGEGLEFVNDKKLIYRHPKDYLTDSMTYTQRFCPDREKAITVPVGRLIDHQVTEDKP